MKLSTLSTTLFLFHLIAYADRPQVLVRSEQHSEICEKIASNDWAKRAFDQLKEKVDTYVSKTQLEPNWLKSRLAMIWDTNYVQAVTKGSRTIGGQGHAPVPTPRFAGARDWKTDYARQEFDHLRPYNDKDGKIMLVNTTTGLEEWVDPSITGHAIERINKEIMRLVAEAAFVYWVTGDQKYAEFAAPVLWQFMHGLSYVESPIILDENGKGPHRIIGTFTYEVIHESAINEIAVACLFGSAAVAAWALSAYPDHAVDREAQTRHALHGQRAHTEAQQQPAHAQLTLFGVQFPLVNQQNRQPQRRADLDGHLSDAKPILAAQQRHLFLPRHA